ncbi:Neurotactin-like protein, partial [Dinothrombium tinctorium]
MVNETEDEINAATAHHKEAYSSNANCSEANAVNSVVDGIGDNREAPSQLNEQNDVGGNFGVAEDEEARKTTFNKDEQFKKSDELIEDHEQATNNYDVKNDTNTEDKNETVEDPTATNGTSTGEEVNSIDLPLINKSDLVLINVCGSAKEDEKINDESPMAPLENVTVGENKMEADKNKEEETKIDDVPQEDRKDAKTNAELSEQADAMREGNEKDENICVEKIKSEVEKSDDVIVKIEDKVNCEQQSQQQQIETKVESNGVHREDEAKHESSGGKQQEEVKAVKTANDCGGGESKKNFWTKVWRSKESQPKSDETDIEVIDSPPTEKKNSSAGNSEHTDVTIPICTESEQKAKQLEEKELTPTHLMFRVQSPYFKYIFSFAIFALLLLLFALTVVFLFPETFDIRYLNLIGNNGGNKKQSDQTPIAYTSCGQIHGSTESDMAVFRGIPYALPPIGQNRWLPPKEPACVKNASKLFALDLKDFCYQRPVTGFNLSFSEDCLYLNIWTQNLNQNAKKLPVLVYIPGDTLTGYTSTDIQWLPTGTQVVKDYNVVFVTISYRLGAFGFMSLKTLSIRDESTNYGLLDLIAALKWINTHIDSFGGDRDMVTILSHGSAASLSLVLATHEEASEYIDRVWLASPSPKFTNATLRQVQDENYSFIRSLNCLPNATQVNTLPEAHQQVLQCLLSSSSAAVLKATPERWYENVNHLPSEAELLPSPILAIDGNVIKDNPFKLMKDTKVKIVIGMNVEETGAYSEKPSFIEEWESENFMQTIEQRLAAIDANVTEEYVKLYRNQSIDSTNEQIYHAMVTDIRYLCPLFASLQLSMAPSHVYTYVNEYKPSFPIKYNSKYSNSKMTVHGIDVLALLDLLTNWFVINPKANDDMYMDTMQEQFKLYLNQESESDFALRSLDSGFTNIISTNGTL